MAVFFNAIIVFGQYNKTIGYGYSDLHSWVYDYRLNSKAELQTLTAGFYAADGFYNTTYGVDSAHIYTMPFDSVSKAVNRIWYLGDLQYNQPFYWNDNLYLKKNFYDSTFIVKLNDSFKILDFGFIKYKNNHITLLNWFTVGNSRVMNLSYVNQSVKQYVWQILDRNGQQFNYETQLDKTDAICKENSALAILQHESGPYKLWVDSVKNVKAILSDKTGSFLAYQKTNKYYLFLFRNNDTLKYLKTNHNFDSLGFEFIRIPNAGKQIYRLKFIGDLDSNGIVITGIFDKAKLVSYQLGSFVVQLDTNGNPLKYSGIRCVLSESDESMDWVDKIIQHPSGKFIVGWYSQRGTYISSPSHPGWIRSETLKTEYNSFNQLAKMGWNYPLDQTVISKKEIAVYPNPTEEILYVDGIDNALCEVMDVSGRKILGQKLENARLDVSALKPGIYLLSIAGPSGQTYTSRFIKN